MRILCVGDLHIGASLGGVSRFDEHRRVLEYCQELDEQVDLTVNLGDVFHMPKPHPVSLGLFAKYLSDYDYILVGNHDRPSRGQWHAFRAYGDAGHSKIVDVPFVKFGDPTLIFLPYVTDWQAKEAGYPSAQDWLDDFCRKCVKEAPKKILAFAHLEVLGAEVGQVRAWREVGTRVPDVLMESRKVSKVYVGHIHSHQHINKATIVGSSIRVDYSEADQLKVAAIYDTESGEELIPLPVADLSVLELDLNDDWDGKFVAKDYAIQIVGKWVKVRINVTEVAASHLNPAKLALSLLEAGAVHVFNPEVRVSKTAEKRSERHDRSLPVSESLRLFAEETGVRDPEGKVEFALGLAKEADGENDA